MTRLWLALVVMAGTAAAQAAKPNPFNVDFQVGWDGCYRPMQWTPVAIDITTTLDKPLAGSIAVIAQQDSQTEMTIQQPIVITPDTPLSLRLVTKLAFTADSVRVVILDERGRVPWQNSYELFNFSEHRRLLTSVDKDDVLIGVAGAARFGLRDLARYGSTSGNGRVYVREKLLRYLPWDWTGYGGLDLLVLYDPDWVRLTPQQSQAIFQWVSNGGRLLIVPGSHPLPADHPLASLLPFTLREPREVVLTPRALSDMGLDRQASGKVGLWLDRVGVELMDWQTVGPGSLFLAHGPVGFGRVGVLSGNPAELGTPPTGRAARFWAETAAGMFPDRTGLVTPRDTPRAESEDPDFSRRFEMGPQATASNAVLEHLLTIPEMRPLHVGWIVAFLLALAAVIGPLDYMVLKRLDRLPWTWATCTGTILLSTIGAYYGVQALRAGQLQVRCVWFVDGMQPADPPGADRPGPGWATVYTGIFAPASSQYELTGLGPDQWWSSIAPTESETIYAFSPEIATRRLPCVQQDGANVPAGVPISIWSMQCLLAEHQVGQMPLSATISRDPRDRASALTVTVNNHADIPITSGYVRLAGGGTLLFGSVPPKASRQFSGTLQQRSSWEIPPPDAAGDRGEVAFHVEDRPPASGGNLTDGQVFGATGVAQRTEAIQWHLSRGAAVVCARYDPPVSPYLVANRSCTSDCIQLVRLLVLPSKGTQP